MRTGDFLGGKSFLFQMDDKSTNSQMIDHSTNAKLSVIASSNETIVYSLDEKKFKSLSDNMQNVIVEGIMKNGYFDERDIETKVNGEK